MYRKSNKAKAEEAALAAQATPEPEQAEDVLSDEPASPSSQTTNFIGVPPEPIKGYQANDEPASPEPQDEPAKPQEVAEPEEEFATAEEIKGKQVADIKGKLPAQVELKVNALANGLKINPDKIVIVEFDEEESKSNPNPKKRTDLAVPDGDRQNVYKVLTDEDYDWKGASGFQISSPETRDKDGNPVGGTRFHCYLLGKIDASGHFEEEVNPSEKKKKKEEEE